MIVVGGQRRLEAGEHAGVHRRHPRLRLRSATTGATVITSTPAARRSAISWPSPVAPVTRMSTRSIGQILAKARRPSLLESATTTTVRARWAISSLTAASVSLLVRRPVGHADAVDAEDRQVEGQPLEHRHRQRADELVGLGAHDPAGDDELDLRAHGELVGDVEGVGDDRDRSAAAVAESSRRSARRARARATSVVVVPPLRPTTLPGTTSSAAAAAIAALLVGPAGQLVAQRQVVGDAVSARPRRGSARAAAGWRARRGRGARWRRTRRAARRRCRSRPARRRPACRAGPSSASVAASLRNVARHRRSLRQLARFAYK